jgi:predicted AAA+ superfamily ATPase
MISRAMAVSDDQILTQNPWWTNPSWRSSDPHLMTLDAQPMRLPADFVAGLDIETAGIHVLRGPRQVGKSTDLKLLVERALADGRPPRSVLYLALDLLEGQGIGELALTIKRAKSLAGEDRGSLLLLDEVTAVERWQTALKALWDDGTLRRDTVVCTGSSAVDLQRGAAERLPGRRGAGDDHLLLPQSFAAFATATDATVPPSPRLTVGELRAPEGHALLEDARIHRPALDAALDRYLTFGGFPAAVAEAANGLRAPSPQTRRVVYDSLVKELQRRGASIPAGDALLTRVARALGSQTNWSDLARQMDVPLGRHSPGRTSHHTLRSYIELMASGYFLFIVHFWRMGPATNDLSRNRKLFFADPLLHTVALDRAPGLRIDTPALVENVVGMALLRRYEPPDRLAENFVTPERLHVWRTGRGSEIDFVAGPRSALEVVEVKYQNDPGRRAAAAAAQGLPGRPVIMATKNELSAAENYSLVPASLLLWALG